MGMLNDAGLFKAWGPPCTGPSARVSLNGEGAVTVHPAIVDAVLALNAVLVLFKYVTRKADTGAYVCRDKVGQPGHKSIHALKLALDINWLTNMFGKHLVTDMSREMIDAILAIRTNSGAQVWTWGGDWRGNKDAMHFQIACTPADIASGINMATVVGHIGPAPTHSTTPTQQPEDEDMTYFVQVNEAPTLSGDLPVGAIVKVTDSGWVWMRTNEAWDYEQRIARITRRDAGVSAITQKDMRAIQQTHLDIYAVNQAAA